MGARIRSVKQTDEHVEIRGKYLNVCRPRKLHGYRWRCRWWRRRRRGGSYLGNMVNRWWWCRVRRNNDRGRRHLHRWTLRCKNHWYGWNICTSALSSPPELGAAWNRRHRNIVVHDYAGFLGPRVPRKAATTTQSVWLIIPQ